MSKKKTAIKQNSSINIALPNSITKDELRQIIVDAVFEIDTVKKQREQEQQEKRKAEWWSVIGYRDYSNEKNRFIRFVKQKANFFIVFLKVMFLPKKRIKNDVATTALLKLSLSGFFSLIKWFLLLFALAFIVNIFYSPNGNLLAWYIAVPWALIAFMFSRLFRMASFEIENMQDHNYVFGIFACVTSLISIIVAVIAIIKGV